MTSKEHWVLTLVCPDQPGIVHAISGVIVASGGNITESQQYSSEDTGRFFMRMQIEAVFRQADFEKKIAEIAKDYDLEYSLDRVDRPIKTVVLVSRAAHCLNDVLFRQRSGQLPIVISRVFGNHADLSGLAGFYGVDFETLPILDSESKKNFENRLRSYIVEENIELIVLARFMQILSPDFCAEFKGKIINIHHSFLPGFKGANPYAQAHSRGVKLIGATAHFVTDELDEGPIIEQNVTRVDHSATKRDLVEIGQDIESKTLSQAIRWFAQHRVLLDGQRTVIFR